MKKHKRKGLSLVEVLTAMALISLLLFFFGGTIAGQFKSLTETKQMTKDYFAAAQTVETYAQKIRNEWQAAKKIDPATPSIALPHIDPGTPLSVESKPNVELPFASDTTPYTVKVKNVYAIQADINEHRPLYYYVTDTDIPPLPAPQVESLELELSGGAQLGYVDDTDTKIYAECVIASGEKSIHNNYQWYLSKPTHLGRKSILEDMEEVAAYPIFPGDYDVLRDKYGKAVAGKDMKDVALTSLNVEELAGRHIIVTVTPAAASGKLGPMFVSRNSIYFYGVPDSKNLLWHYDANNLQANDTVQIRPSGGNLFVKKLLNTVKETAASDHTHVANGTSGDQPQLCDAVFGRTQDGLEIRGHILSFADNQFLVSQALPAENVLTVITVARSTDTLRPGNWLTITDGSTLLQWDASGVSSYIMGASMLFSRETLLSTDEWVIDITVLNGGSIQYYPGNRADTTPITGGITMPGGALTVQLGAYDEASQADVAEIAVYNKAFTDTQVKALQAFYKKKYGLHS